MSVPSIAMEETAPRYRLTVDQYHRMGEAGIRRIGRELAALADRATVSVQCPLALSEASEPEPDVALLRPRADDYSTAHPEPGDVLLLVEVADSSLALDREVKGRLYALAGIPEYWVVDLTADAIEVRLRPVGELWGETRRVHRGGTVAPAAFPDHRIAVDDILPPAGD